MALALDERESRALVDPAGRDEDVVRPKCELPISRRAREADAPVDEPGPEPESSCVRLDSVNYLRRSTARSWEKWMRSAFS